MYRKNIDLWEEERGVTCHVLIDAIQNVGQMRDEHLQAIIFVQSRVGDENYLAMALS